MKTISVYANPLVGPVGMHNVLERWVGAVPDVEASAKSKKQIFSYSDKPVTVEANAYYRRAVTDGDLLPADSDTAKMCGVLWKSEAKPKESKAPKYEEVKSPS